MPECATGGTLDRAVMVHPQAMLLSCAAALALSAPEKADVHLSDLVADADLVVVGTVERVVQVERDPDESEGWLLGTTREVPLADVRVLRILKGPPGIERASYPALGTWTCDTTTAVAGEAAVFFLSRSGFLEQEGLTFQAGLARELGAAPLLYLLGSGDGRMPIAEVEGHELVHGRYLRGDAMRHDREDNPPVPLEGFEEEVRALVVAQRAVFLRARNLARVDDRSGWELAVALDRTATLTSFGYGDPHTRRITIDLQSFCDLRNALRGTELVSLSIAAPDLSTERLVRYEGRSEPLLRIRPGPASAGPELERGLELWAAVRGLFEDPFLTDLREADARTLAELAREAEARPTSRPTGGR